MRPQPDAGLLKLTFPRDVLKEVSPPLIEPTPSKMPKDAGLSQDAQQVEPEQKPTSTSKKMEMDAGVLSSKDALMDKSPPRIKLTPLR